MAFISKINGYEIKDANARSRLDTLEQTVQEGVGKIDEIHVNNTKLAISTDGKKSVNIAVDGTYDADNNKVATVQTVTNKVTTEIKALVEGDGVAGVVDTFKDMQSYIETHGSEAVGMANNITKNTQDITNINTELENLALEETYNSTEESLDLELGNVVTGRFLHYAHISINFTNDETNYTITGNVTLSFVSERSTYADYDSFHADLKEFMLTSMDGNYSSQRYPSYGGVTDNTHEGAIVTGMAYDTVQDGIFLYGGQFLAANASINPSMVDEFLCNSIRL